MIRAQLPKLKITEINDNNLSEKEFYTSLISMQNKSPGNDEPKKIFLGRYKRRFLNSCRTAKLKIELSTSQRQAVIKLIEKKIRIKHLLKIGDQFFY